MELTIDGRGDGYRSRAPGVRMAQEVADLFQTSFKVRKRRNSAVING
jgi:hypothetical protein